MLMAACCAAWTDLPGMPMHKGVGSQPGLFAAQLDQNAAQFVFNNGENDWDSPMNTENYSVKGPGEFLVQSGQVSKLS
jgi:hypothetical protein